MSKGDDDDLDLEDEGIEPEYESEESEELDFSSQRWGDIEDPEDGEWN